MTKTLSEYVVTKLHKLNIAVVAYAEIQNGINYILLGGYTLSVYNTGKYVCSANMPDGVWALLKKLELGLYEINDDKS